MQLTILKAVSLSASVTIVSACEPPAVWGSRHSLTNKLEVGMSANDVSAIIGNPEFLDISDTDPTIYCRSYI